MAVAVGDDANSASPTRQEIIAHPDSGQFFFLDMDGVSVWHGGPPSHRPGLRPRIQAQSNSIVGRAQNALSTVTHCLPGTGERRTDREQ